MNKIVKIEKQNIEEIVAWKVDATGVAPKTKILIKDPGLIAVVKIDGKTRVAKSGETDLYKLFGKPQFGHGKDPYEDIVIYAVNQANEFTAEWGLAGPNALPCFDPDLHIDAKAMVIGTYTYTVSDYYAFVNSVVDEDGYVRRSSLREKLRSRVAGAARAVIAGELARSGVAKCQTMYGVLCEDLVQRFNNELGGIGLTVTAVNIINLDYTPDHKAEREKMNAAKSGVVIKKIENEGKLDDAAVLKAHNEAEAVLIYAQAKADQAKNGGKMIVCPRCKELNNANANYCSKCHEQLH